MLPQRRGVILCVICTACSIASLSEPEEELGALFAESQADALSLLQKTRRTEQCGNSMPVQVFADVDDTFKSSGGSYPAGCDGQYGKGVIYPGMAQFALELARGPQDATRVLKPAVMSARPQEISSLKVKADSPLAVAMSASLQSSADPANFDQYNAEMKLQVPKGLESFSYETSGIAHIVDGTGSGEEIELDLKGSRYGDMANGVDVEKMGETKFGHFEAFFSAAVDRSDEACVVWVGDDGQGDCHPAGFKMRRFTKRSRRQRALKAAFIHRLRCKDKPFCQAEPNPRGDLPPLFMFDNYLEAAKIALQHGFISHGGFGRVKKAVESFNAVYCDRYGNTAAPETVGDRGCAMLHQALKKEGPVTRVSPLQFRTEKRFKTFCSTCCNGGKPNGVQHFEFDGAQWRCHNMYHSWGGSYSWRSWFHMDASDSTCQHLCAQRV